MKQIFSIALLLTFAVQIVFSQCSETQKPRVLLAGDSWAFFMGVDNTINDAFAKWGHSNYKSVTNQIIAENGAQTDDFLKISKQDEIRNLLNNNPTIDIVHLSIGGNDLLGRWKVSSTPQEAEDIEHEVGGRLLQIIDFIKSCRPGIKIVWSGYCYPNFGEVIPTSVMGSGHPFNDTWQKMEYPDFITINTMLNKFTDDFDSVIRNDPQVEYVKATGLMQYVFGQPQALAVPPGGTYPAKSVPLPYGDPNYPSPITSMNNFGIIKDAFHLSPEGYLALLEYQTQKFYQKYLMDDKYYLPEGDDKTGSVSSLGNISDSLFLGNEGGEDFSVALSFNTTDMEARDIEKASIFLRRESLSGANPVDASLEVKIKSGNFGASATIEAGDYSESGDVSETTCLFGSKANDGEWIRLDLPASMFSFINQNAPTQFLISSTATTEGKITFTGLGDDELAPVLNIAYVDNGTGIKELQAGRILSVHPNPATNTLHISTNFSTEDKTVEIFDLLGRKVLEQNLIETSPIDISLLNAGIYAVSVKSAQGILSQKFVKE